VVGPDGIAGTGDDGIVLENFETERDGTAGITISNLPLGTPGVLNDTIGVWVGTAPGGINTLAGVACAGDIVPPTDKYCVIDPRTGWMAHPLPAGHLPGRDGSAHADGRRDVVERPELAALRLPLRPTSRDAGDTTRFRQLAAFMTNRST